MKRIFILLLLFNFSYITHALTLKIGVRRNTPPFCMQVSQNNMYSGFEPDLMAEICKRLQAQCQFISVSFEEFFTQVYDKKIDLAIGEINITSYRKNNFLFSMPYFLSPGQILTLSSSPIKSINALRSKTIGFATHSLYRKFLLDQFNDEITTQEYANINGAFNALKTGDVDALLLTKIDENHWITTNANAKQFRTIGAPIYLGEGYGIMSNKQQFSLITKINQILKDMENDGSYLKIYNLYFADDTTL